MRINDRRLNTVMNNIKAAVHSFCGLSLCQCISIASAVGMLQVRDHFYACGTFIKARMESNMSTFCKLIQLIESPLSGMPWAGLFQRAITGFIDCL